MKLASILKKTTDDQLGAFSGFCFIVPYLIPLFQKNAAVIGEELGAKLLFAFAAIVIVVQLAAHIGKRVIRILLVTALWALLELLILLEAFMFCFAGHSFDQSFLLHFNLEVLTIEAIKAFWLPVAGILLIYLAAVTAAGILIGKTVTRKDYMRSVAVTLFAMILFFVPKTPCSILCGVIVDNVRASCRDRSFINRQKIQATPGKNLVFIVIESLERNYLDEKHFPNLIPNLSTWAKSEKTLFFENMTSAAGNTFDFLYQSHMGDYIYSITDSDYADRQVSLSLILKQAGYASTYLQADNLVFASTGTFVKKLDYDLALDCRNPMIKKQVSELGEWGFRDYELLKIAAGEFEKLAAQNKPFVFTLFTVDSHAPFGVIGKKSLTYTAPDGEKRQLLSALHTTDAALGKFLEFIKNHPKGKDTVIVISGDHLLMKGLASGSQTVQAMLEYKPRKNLLTFIINGRDHGKFEPQCWPVDLAPVILYQMGVKHNAKFPRGVNCLVEKNAPPRVFDPGKYSGRRKEHGAGRNGEPANFLANPVWMSGSETRLTMHMGKTDVKCDPLEEFVGTMMEFHSRTGLPTIYKDYLQRDHVNLFQTNHKDRDLFYLFCSCRKNLFHFLFGEKEQEKCFLAAVIGGWYKVVYSSLLSDLKLSGLDEPLPRISDADIDVSKDIVVLKKGDWSFPLFSKTDTYLPQCAIAAADDKNGKETLMRKHFHNEHEMKDLYDLLAAKDKMTVIAPPDSPLHRRYNVPEDKIDQIMRLHITPDGKQTELIPMRQPREGWIGRTGKGCFCYFEQGQKTAVPLDGSAPAKDFDGGMCYAITFDTAGRLPISFKSFRESSIAAKMMVNRNNHGKSLLICGKNSEFLKQYYPHLAAHNVLFSITGSAIRHSLQYTNGNFRIPSAAEPVNVLDAASAHLIDQVLIITWGNASFALSEKTLDSWFTVGNELAVKLPLHNPGGFVLFHVNNPSWLPDIIKAYKTDILLLGNGRSKIPEMLSNARKGKYFISISRGFGWEMFWNNKIEFVIPPAKIN